MKFWERAIDALGFFSLLGIGLIIWTLLIMLWFSFFAAIAKTDTPKTYICESAKYSAIYGKKNCGKAAAERAMRLSIRRNYQAEIGGKLGRREAAKAIRTYECRERV